MKKTLIALALAGTALALPSFASAQAASYSIDPTHTFVTFEVVHFGVSTSRGRFDKKEGSVQFDRAGKSGRADITIDMTSISTGLAPFDGHLKSKDFFDVQNHPKARFVGERFVFDGDKVSEVVGTLTLLGKTLPVTLKSSRFGCYDNPMLKREVCGGDFETTLQRSQWGMSWGLPGVPDSVRLLVQIEAVRQ